jgi:hypothetical protein
MRDTTTNTGSSESSYVRLRRGLARFMAVDGPAWDAIRSDSRLGTEIVFQAIAVLYCSAFFAFSTFNIAAGLLGYPVLAAAAFGLCAAFGLGSIDRQLRIQSRGVQNASRGLIFHVRAGSMTIVAISGLLMAAHTFRDDVEAYLFAVAQEVRAGLEASPQYAPALESARSEVAQASQARERADALRQEISRIRVEEARAWESHKNECEGNTTGNQARVPGCGVRARGHAATATRLGQERESLAAELSEHDDADERLLLAQATLAQIDEQIDADVALTVQGASKRIEALFALLRTNWAAALTIVFWVMLGMLPDLMMWIALSRSPNEATYEVLRGVQDAAIRARLAQLRSTLRMHQAEELAPLDVRVTPLAGPAPQTGAPNLVVVQEQAA